MTVRALVPLCLLLFACDAGVRPGRQGAPPPGSPAVPEDMWSRILGQRRRDYGAALRTAAIKLLGDLPTRDEIEDVATATDPGTVYAQMIDRYMADPRFARTLIAYFADTFRTGGAGHATAALYAAMVVHDNQPFTRVLTAAAGTCPTYSPQDGFHAADCGGNGPTAGVLTDPGVMSLWYGNLAFRRVRWVQETFACRKLPAEVAASPQPVMGALYTAPWPFLSIAGGAKSRVDFHDVSGVVCANCHATANHVAPLFAHFDGAGKWQPDFAVPVPVPGRPLAELSDWLPPGQVTAWRKGVPAPDLPALGRAMADDGEVLACAVSRVWRWLMDKPDLVAENEQVPAPIVTELENVFLRSGLRLRPVMRAALLSEDFTRF
jgi:hypothetical protein